LWAVYDVTSSFYIFDDATGSNITEARNRRVGAFITDSSADIIPFYSSEIGTGIKYVYKEY